MLNQTTSAVLLMLGGALAFFTALKSIINPRFLENYVKASPKAFIWRKMFGEDRAKKILKNIFAPLGVIGGIAFIIYGIVLLI
jgi:hypothetical protein